MLNIDFNANDLRFVVYIVIAVLISILGGRLSKNIKSKKNKAIYIITVILFNLLLAFRICKLYAWL